MNTSSNIIIYEGAAAGVEVRLEQETVWPTQECMGLLFGRELERAAVCGKFAHTESG